jgi:uncharacterized protein (DUF885 family)
MEYSIRNLQDQLEQIRTWNFSGGSSMSGISTKLRYIAYLCLIVILAGVLLESCLGSPSIHPTASSTTAPLAVASSPSRIESTAGSTPASAASSPQPVEPTASPTATSGLPTPTPQPTPADVDQAIARLQGLPLDDFFEESYKQLILRSPQKVTALGLTKVYGLRNDQLDDLSDAYQRETRRLETAILELLNSYDRENLPSKQQIDYDAYHWYLDMRVRGHRFAYHDYPLHHHLDSYQFLIEQLFTEYQPLDNRQDAEDYIARLSQVNRQVDQLLEGLKIREKMGIMPPDFIIRLTRNDLRQRLGTSSLDPARVEPTTLNVYSHFQDKVLKMRGISDEEKGALLVAALQQIEISFIPAHLKLLQYLDEIEPKATDEAGAWKLPDGEAYYAWKLRWETATDLTPGQVHEIGLQEVDRIKDELYLALKELPNPPQFSSLSKMLLIARSQAGYINTESNLGKAEVIATYEGLLEDVEQKMQPVFDLYPSTEVIILPDESFASGGFYVPGSLDGSRPGSFHAGVGAGDVPKMYMPTTLFHEAVPGHHFQIALTYDLGLPIFRRDVFLNGYAEGWALYAERLAWELGMYDKDPYGNVGRLERELLRAARLVADTGLHAKHWTRNETISYLQRTLGGMTEEADRYVVFPAQATGYKIGMLKFLELRQQAQEALGADFDLAQFHHVVLGSGSLPFEILERLVGDYISEQQ